MPARNPTLNCHCSEYIQTRSILWTCRWASLNNATSPNWASPTWTPNICGNTWSRFCDSFKSKAICFHLFRWWQDFIFFSLKCIANFKIKIYTKGLEHSLPQHTHTCVANVGLFDLGAAFVAFLVSQNISTICVLFSGIALSWIYLRPSTDLTGTARIQRDRTG